MGFLNRLSKFGKELSKGTQKALTKASQDGGGIIGKTLGKALNVGINIGLAGVNFLAKDSTRQAIKTGVKGAYNTSKKIGKSGLNGLAEEAKVGIRSVNLLKGQLVGDAPITTSLFGPDHKITKIAKKLAPFERSEDSLFLGAKAKKGTALLFVAGSVVAGTPKAGREFINMHKGQHDGQLYKNAPINTYSQGPTMGNSYARNAGATGDLVFALHNQRHSGLF